MVIQKIHNANVYLDGTNEQLGRASEVKLPEITPAMSEHKGLGMVGVLQLPAGLQELKLAIKWSGFYADPIMLAANPFASRRLQIRASVERYGAGGLESRLPLVVLCTGSPVKGGLGTLKPQEAADGYDTELTLTYLKVTLDGKELVEIDVHENVWRVDGKDLLEELRGQISG